MSVAMTASCSIRVICLSVTKLGSKSKFRHLSMNAALALSMPAASTTIFLRLLDPNFFSFAVTTK